jgi:prepilin signal peptidase PulO-like enzyme (type II secretory pathway)
LRPFLSTTSLQSLIALLLAAVASFGVLATVDALFAAALAGLMLWLAQSDLDRLELPDLGNLSVAALGSAWVAAQADPSLSLLHAALRLLAAAACLSAVKWTYARLRGFEGLGWGDVKLGAAGAVWLDWPQMPIALLIAAAGGILVVAARGTLTSTPVRASSAIPFGAFLAPSIWLVWFIGRAELF